jgi:hypothetical protein
VTGVLMVVVPVAGFVWFVRVVNRSRRLEDRPLQVSDECELCGLVICDVPSRVRERMADHFQMHMAAAFAREADQT